jgi:hypothetical protein
MRTYWLPRSSTHYKKNLFIDLEKAFDTMQNTLLNQILETYGIPESLIKVIQRNINIAKTR